MRKLLVCIVILSLLISGCAGRNNDSTEPPNDDDNPYVPPEAPPPENDDPFDDPFDYLELPDDLEMWYSPVAHKDTVVYAHDDYIECKAIETNEILWRHDLAEDGFRFFEPEYPQNNFDFQQDTMAYELYKDGRLFGSEMICLNSGKVLLQVERYFLGQNLGNLIMGWNEKKVYYERDTGQQLSYLDDTTVYISQESYYAFREKPLTVTRYNTATGSMMWKAELEKDLGFTRVSSFSTENKFILLGLEKDGASNQSTMVLLLDSTNGKVEWEKPGHLTAQVGNKLSMIIQDDLVFIETSSGEELSRMPHEYGWPLVWNDELYLKGETWLKKIDMVSGKTLWEKTWDSVIYVKELSALEHLGILWLQTDSDWDEESSLTATVHAIDTSTGKAISSYRCYENEYWGSVLIGTTKDERSKWYLILPIADSEYKVIDAATGKELWKFEGHPFYSDSNLLVTVQNLDNGNIEIKYMDKANGKLFHTRDSKGRVLLMVGSYLLFDDYEQDEIVTIAPPK